MQRAIKEPVAAWPGDLRNFLLPPEPGQYCDLRDGLPPLEGRIRCQNLGPEAAQFWVPALAPLGRRPGPFGETPWPLWGDALAPLGRRPGPFGETPWPFWGDAAEPEFYVTHYDYPFSVERCCS